MLGGLEDWLKNHTAGNWSGGGDGWAPHPPPLNLTDLWKNVTEWLHNKTAEWNGSWPLPPHNESGGARNGSRFGRPDRQPLKPVKLPAWPRGKGRALKAARQA